MLSIANLLMCFKTVPFKTGEDGTRKFFNFQREFTNYLCLLGEIMPMKVRHFFPEKQKKKLADNSHGMSRHLLKKKIKK